MSEATSTLWPLLKHLRNGFLNQLLVLVAIIVQSILGNSPPGQTLGFRVIQVYDQRSYNVLLWCDAAHTASPSTHSHRCIRGLLLHAAIGSDEKVRLLRLIYFL